MSAWSRFLEVFARPFAKDAALVKRVEDEFKPWLRALNAPDSPPGK